MMYVSGLSLRFWGQAPTCRAALLLSQASALPRLSLPTSFLATFPSSPVGMGTRVLRPFWFLVQAVLLALGLLLNLKEEEPLKDWHQLLYKGPVALPC